MKLDSYLNYLQEEKSNTYDAIRSGKFYVRDRDKNKFNCKKLSITKGFDFNKCLSYKNCASKCKGNTNKIIKDRCNKRCFKEHVYDSGKGK